MSKSTTNYLDLLISLHKAERGLVKKIILEFFSLRERCIIRNLITPMTRVEMGIMAVDSRDYVFLDELYSKTQFRDLGLASDGFDESLHAFLVDRAATRTIHFYIFPVWDHICKTCRDKDDIDVITEIFSHWVYCESALQYKNDVMVFFLIENKGDFDYFSEFLCAASGMSLDIFKWFLETISDEIDTNDVENYELVLKWGNIECVRYYENTYGKNPSDIPVTIFFRRSISLISNEIVLRHFVRNSDMDELDIKYFCQVPRIAKAFYLEGILPESFIVNQVDTCEEIEWIIEHGGRFSHSCFRRALLLDKFCMFKNYKEAFSLENITDYWNDRKGYIDHIFNYDLPDDLFLISESQESSPKIIEFVEGHHKRGACHLIRNDTQCPLAKESGKLFCSKHSYIE